MPNSKGRKKHKRQAEEQRRKARQRQSASTTDDFNRRLSQEDVGLGRRGRRDSTESCYTVVAGRVGGGAHDDIDGDEEAGVLSSAFSWFSYGLDYVMPSRKLARELEATKERLRDAEDQLKKEKLRLRRSLPPGGLDASMAASFSVTPGPPPPPPCFAPPPPPPPPPPPDLLAPKPIVIKRGKKSNSLLAANTPSRPLVTCDDLKNIKLKPSTRVLTRSQSKRNGQSAGTDGPLVSLQQLKSVRLKRAHTVSEDLKPGSGVPVAASGLRKRLRRLDIQRSPGGTPLSLAAEHCMNKENLDMTPLLSNALRRKFSLAKPCSPIASPSFSDSDSSFVV